MRASLLIAFFLGFSALTMSAVAATEGISSLIASDSSHSGYYTVF